MTPLEIRCWVGFSRDIGMIVPAWVPEGGVLVGEQLALFEPSGATVWIIAPRPFETVICTLAFLSANT